MVRVRIAGGTVTSEQMRTLADLSKRFGKGVSHVTTRQDIQIHDVATGDTPEVMRGLYSVGLTSKGGGGNTVRNIMACPYAGICPGEVFDVAPFAHAVTQYLITLPGSYNLPRKYKIAFSGCAADCALTQVNDLGFVAKLRDGKPGFSVYAGGGMGGHPQIGDVLEEWVPATEVTRISETVRRLFDRMGDRKNRKRARLRFVFERIGADEFRREYKNELEQVRADGVPACDTVADPGKNPIEQLSNPETALEEKEGVRFFPQSQDGFVAVTLHIPMGDISSEDMIKLADIVEKFSEEKGCRTTQSQNLLIAFVREQDLSALAEELGALSINVLAPDPLESFIACKGAATCRLGLCLSQEVSKACAKVLAQDGIDLAAFRKLDIRLNGCPNSCGQHPIGTIGMFGTAQRADGRLFPNYKITLGARRGEGQTRLGQDVGSVPARALPQFMLDLIRDFQQNGNEGEAFADYYDRKGIEHFKQLIDRHSRIPSYEQNADFYKDFEQDEDFSLAGRGPGECGAGVFEVITEDIVAAKKTLENIAQVDEKQVALFDAALATTRSLLITRGVDSPDPDEIVRSFEKHFVDTNLVSAEFRGLLARVRAYISGVGEALQDQEDEIRNLLECVELLFSTLDGDLKFHPPEAAADEEVSEDKNTISSAELDLKGVACPMNFVKAKLKLETMTVGDKLSIILDEGEPIQNVPASFREEGQEVVEMDQIDENHWRVLVQKKH